MIHPTLAAMPPYTPSLLCQNCASPLAHLNTTRLSPNSYLLGTNHPPSELEIYSIRRAVADAKSDQLRLERDIAQLEATLDALYNEKGVINDYIREHEVLLAPARRILPEILSEIFQWCFADGMLASAADAPVVLGQVCNYWRSIAISTPNLWSSLNLHLRPNNAKFKPDLANTALSRSGACPLTIDLIFTGDDYDWDGDWDEHAESCLDSVLNHSRRWKSMYFQLPQCALQKLSVVKYALPLLERLCIRPTSPPFDMILDAFEVAPRLSNLCTDMLPNVLQVPWENLKNFEGSGHNQRESLDWLHRSPNLVECVINFDYEDEWHIGQPSTSMAHFPRLHKLEVTTDGDDGLEDLFNCLVTPLLSDLRIEYSDLGPWAQAPFISFLHRSTCALRQLHLIDIPLTDVQLIECLRMVPSLTELVIRGHDLEPTVPGTITNSLVQQLIYEPSKVKSLPMVPQLHAITFEGPFTVDGQILRRMIASRWKIDVAQMPKIARLKTVKLKMDGDLGPVTRARLEIYKNEGLGLEVEVVD